MTSVMPSANSNPLFVYNAIQLSAKQVAESFVAPRAFQTLIRHDNAILAGPRGSGKTTLLKMLQSEALEAWTDPTASEVRKLVRSTGVFIGVDRMWSDQIRVQTSTVSDAFGVAAYALHMGRSLTRTLAHKTSAIPESARTHLRVEMSPETIAAICRRIASLFKLPYSTPTFGSTLKTFGDQLSLLGSYRHRLESIDTLPDWAYLDPIQLVSEVVDDFNGYTGDLDHKWSLLFDEMELAPSSILRDVLGGLRGQSRNLTFKISIAPILSLNDLLVGERGAIHGHDVEYISLNSGVRRDSTLFVQSLIQRQLDAVGGNTTTVWRAFGESAFDNGETAGQTRIPQANSPYKANSSLVRDMKYLQSTDATFSDYLATRKVDLERIDSMKDHERAAVIRKVRNLVVVRAYYRKEGARRSRKSLELYSGASSLLNFPDGNPRMATILAKRLALEYASSSNGRVSAAKQAAVIQEVSDRFMALLHAQAGIYFDERPMTLVDLIDRIGEALARRIVTEPFRADVPAGFFVDTSIRRPLELLLTQAINTGAIVHMPRRNDSPPVTASAIGGHFRLSYLLSARYGIPMRTGKTIALSALISEPRGSAKQTTGDSEYLAGLEPEA